MYKVRVVLALAAFATLIGLLNACSSPESKNIRFGLSTQALVLDPRFATDAVSTRIIHLLYSLPVKFDEHSRPVPGLTDWQMITPTHYRFRLRTSNMQFHNQEPLTALDIKSTYESVLDSATASPHRQSLSIIKSVQQISDTELDFYLHRADLAFPGYLVVAVMPHRLIAQKHDFNKLAIGSGPFRFHSWPDPSLLRITRVNDNQIVEFVHVENATTRVLKLVKGELDMLQNDLPGELIKYLQGFKFITIAETPGSSFSYLSFNLRDPQLADRRVRLAIAHAINRTKMINMFFSQKTRVAGAIFTPEHWAGHPELSGYAYDPERAKALLHEAGYNKVRPLVLTYKTTSNPFRLRIATLVQHQLEQVGIKVQIRSYEWTTFYNDIKKGNFHLFSLSWVAVKSPDMFRYAYHTNSIPERNPKQPGMNRNAFSDPQTDALIEAAENELDSAKRVLLFRKLHERLHELLPVVPLWYEQNTLAFRSNIQGYQLHADGSFDSLLTTQKISDNGILTSRSARR